MNILQNKKLTVRTLLDHNPYKLKDQNSSLLQPVQPLNLLLWLQKIALYKNVLKFYILKLYISALMKTEHVKILGSSFLIENYINTRSVWTKAQKGTIISLTKTWTGTFYMSEENVLKGLVSGIDVQSKLVLLYHIDHSVRCTDRVMNSLHFGPRVSSSFHVQLSLTFLFLPLLRI